MARNPNWFPGTQIEQSNPHTRPTIIPPAYDPKGLDKPHRPTTPPPPLPPRRPRPDGSYSQTPGKQPKASPGSYSDIPGNNRTTGEEEVSVLQEIFQEAENELYAQEFENGTDDAPPTRRDGTAAQTVDRQKATDQMPPTLREGIASRTVDRQRVSNMQFTPVTTPKRPAAFRPQNNRSREVNEETSLLGEIFQESSF